MNGNQIWISPRPNALVQTAAHGKEFGFTLGLLNWYFLFWVLHLQGAAAMALFVNKPDAKLLLMHQLFHYVYCSDADAEDGCT